MNSPILRTITTALMPVLLMVAVWFLLRGHNEPGGGFIAGLIAASATALYGFAYGPEGVRATTRWSPRTIMAVGVLIALAGGIFGVLQGGTFLTAVWWQWSTPLGLLKVGSPMIFDLGVMLVVVGAVNSVLLELTEARFPAANEEEAG